MNRFRHAALIAVRSSAARLLVIGLALGIGAPTGAAPTQWGRISLASYPREVVRRCGGKRSRMRQRWLTLFGKQRMGHLLECYTPCPEQFCPDAIEYRVFVLRQQGEKWTILHRAVERYEESTHVIPFNFVGRQYLLELHHSAGRAVTPELVIYGGDETATRLQALYRARVAYRHGTDAEITDIAGICRIQEQDGKLEIAYVGERQLQAAGRSNLPVVLRRERKCTGPVPHWND